MPPSGLTKAAKLLTALDPATAAKLLKSAGPQTVKEIAAELAYLRNTGSPAQVDFTESVREFLGLLNEAGKRSEADFVEEMLQNSLGREESVSAIKHVQDLVQARDPFVDLSAPKAEVTEGEEVAEAPAAPTVTVEDIAAMIQKVTGAAEEDISVVSTTFHKQKSRVNKKDQEKKEGKEFYLDIARRASLGILAVGALLALKMFGKGKSTKGEPAPALEGQAAAAGAGHLLPAPEGQMNPELVRRQITRALENNPEEVSRLFLSWVGSEEGKV